MEDTMTEIKERVRAYIHDSAHVEKSKIQDDTFIFREGFIDSMGFIILITYLEEAFGIKTNDSDMVEENFESIDAITDFVSRKS